ncbi:helix-turn-helix transcriptional regulator [Photobacterium aphoticum]|uniref:AraC family transcriptional regulator n=1 Tax=Photobacterium aphoticum TaxID=754436 RepID=A0A0J1GRV4_9GAMM|nr:helix-turn-helix transcriptional regulator [Photobacterium aphoticum]KLV02475.1 AraC family transcriptional regulator [Photobacterium aphoticum]PSU56960.1 AraC family transcriptional regulator [Photobacterium aphoticum]GHA64852.1 AraC family transcriptional regulator [Photobacterium aphoticum]
MNKIYQPLFDNDNPPCDIFFGHEVFLPNTTTPNHSHPWGQLQVINGGILELKAEDKRFLSPSQYAVWVPAGVRHESYIRRSLNYCSMNIIDELAKPLPDYTCLLEVSPIMEAIINDFKARCISVPDTEQDKRLAKVLLDQVYQAKEHEQFLPSSNDKLLQPILHTLEHQPTNEKSLKEWADELHTTERTLARHCQDKLGMSFTEWRQRRKFLYSLHLLRKGLSVKEIALTLGYHQASPFISLFKRHAACTPEQYRQRFYPRTEQPQ